MIINFTVGNYRSFKDKKVLSMEATAIKELNESVIEKEGYRLLPSAVIYGANSSGKSNFLKAIGKFGEIVNYSSKMSSTDKLTQLYTLMYQTKYLILYYQLQGKIKPTYLRNRSVLK